MSPTELQKRLDDLRTAHPDLVVLSEVSPDYEQVIMAEYEIDQIVVVKKKIRQLVGRVP